MKAIEQLDAARLAVSQGNFQIALEHLVWFHEHALEEDSALRGVRLSFALVDWIELGKKYSPASEALQKKLGSYTSDLLAGNLNQMTLRDAVAINEWLNDWQANRSLFLELLALDAQFANQFSSLFLPSIVKANDYPLAKKVLIDPLNLINNFSNDLKESVSYIQAARATHMDEAVNAMVSGYIENAKMILTIYQNTGDAELVEDLRAAAISTAANEPYSQDVVSNLSAF